MSSFRRNHFYLLFNLIWKWKFIQICNFFLSQVTNCKIKIECGRTKIMEQYLLLTTFGLCWIRKISPLLFRYRWIRKISGQVVANAIFKIGHSSSKSRGSRCYWSYVFVVSPRILIERVLERHSLAQNHSVVQENEPIGRNFWIRRKMK